MAKRPSDGLREIADKHDKLFEGLMDLAVEVGADPINLSPYNALVSIRAALREKQAWQKTATDMGYTSVAIALKAKGQTLKFPSVPKELQAAPPPHWIRKAGAEEIRVGGKVVVRRVPAVTAKQAMRDLKNLLPVMEQFCHNASDEDIDGMKKAFYDLTYDEFVEQTFKFVAEDAGRSEENSAVTEEEETEVDNRVPIGELILQNESSCLRWCKSRTDFSIFVKESKRLINPEWVEKARMTDLLQSDYEEGDERREFAVASLLLIDSFFDLAGISLPDLHHYNERLDFNSKAFLPDSGRAFLTRLRKLGLGVMISDYQRAVND